VKIISVVYGKYSILNRVCFQKNIRAFTLLVISIPWTIGYEGLGRNGVARIPWYQNTFKPWARQKLGIDD